MSSYADFVTDCLIGALDDIDVYHKSMFGGFGIYHRGTMFALIADDVVYFKVDDSNRADYENAQMEPFLYQAKGKSVTMSYWQLPEELLEDKDQLAIWARKSFAIAERAATKKKAKKKTKKKTKKAGR